MMNNGDVHLWQSIAMFYVTGKHIPDKDKADNVVIFN